MGKNIFSASLKNVSANYKLRITHTAVVSARFNQLFEFGVIDSEDHSS